MRGSLQGRNRAKGGHGAGGTGGHFETERAAAEEFGVGDVGAAETTAVEGDAAHKGGIGMPAGGLYPEKAAGGEAERGARHLGAPRT